MKFDHRKSTIHEIFDEQLDARTDLVIDNVEEQTSITEVYSTYSSKFSPQYSSNKNDCFANLAAHFRQLKHISSKVF